MKRFFAAQFMVLAAGIVLAHPANLKADPRPTKADPAAELVREALQREIYGLEADRQEMLTAAASQSPQFGPALWHQGYIRDGKHDWRKHEDIVQSPQLGQQLSAYERQRKA